VSSPAGQKPTAASSSQPAARHDPSSRWRLGDLARASVAVLAGAIGLAVADWVLPGFPPLPVGTLLALAVVLALLGAVLRPVLVRLAVLTGWPGAVLLAVFGQAIVVYAAFALTLGRGTISFGTAVVASWLVAGIATAVLWLLSAGTAEGTTASLLRDTRRRRVVPADADIDGVLFVQVDGLPYPVLQTSVMAGTLPTLSRWVRSGAYEMVEWRPTLPATTPASQMGILHGSTRGIPAFRWLDRAEQQVLVANRPSDATVIEAMHSDGHGLLADGGVSVGNLFTGDAAEAYSTMSALRRTQETATQRRSVADFLASPQGLARGVARTVSEVVRERFQAARAQRRDVQPRVHRSWSFAVERAGLLGVMRDLSTALVADAMRRGVRSIYVNYVDYDAVAHHVGVLRPEALSALEGLDGVLGQLERLAEVAGRRYRIVVVSDHGQSQGAVFADRYGEDLASLVQRLSATTVVAAAQNTEGAGRLQGMLASDGSGALDRALVQAADRMTEHTYDAEEAAQAAIEPEAAESRFLVFGSGNLGLVYRTGTSAPLTVDDLAAEFPALVAGLVGHPGVGFVAVHHRDGPVVLGANGEHRLGTGVVDGDDPLAAFGPDAPRFVARLMGMPEAPDVLVNSLVDEMGEVAAFEGLVGCHGGLGGWQDRAVLVHPRDLPLPTGRIVGADALHRVLVGWLEHLGHRGTLPERRVPAYDQRTPQL
jgi:uncharacterized membrane protein YvlD (DUF360 family)